MTRARRRLPLRRTGAREEHIRETYTNLVTDQLYENPSPTADSYYCSKDDLQMRLQTELDTVQSVAERADTITDFDAWKPEKRDIAQVGHRVCGRRPGNESLLCCNADNGQWLLA
ncbi:hypothetical protein DMJ13_25580 [halophilic archaeon]|nr:hypothetical protein DMJ13_25580 [halophilic archaeon]